MYTPIIIRFITLVEMFFYIITTAIAKEKFNVSNVLSFDSALNFKLKLRTSTIQMELEKNRVCL